MTTIQAPRTGTPPKVWTVPRWATYMDFAAPAGSDKIDFHFSADHGVVNYYRDFEGGCLEVEGVLTLDFETLAVMVEFDEVEVRIHAGLGDNDYSFSISECRAALAGFESAPPVLRPLIEIRDALAEAVDVYDRSQAGVKNGGAR